MAQGNYSIKDMYQGGPSSFSSDYGDTFTGYRVSAGKLGVSQNPSTANQLAELDKSLKQGAKVAEVQTLDPSTFETIPRHHFEDIRRTAKYAGAKATMHAPVQEMDPAGVSGSERMWSETKRKQVERQLKDVAEKAHLMDQKGNMPITIHSTNVPGDEWEKDPKTGKEKRTTMWVIDQSTGQFSPIKEDEKYEGAITSAKKELEAKQRGLKSYKPQTGKKKRWDPKDKLDSQNTTYWEDSIDQHFFNKERADELIKNNWPMVQKAVKKMREHGINNKEEEEEFLNNYPELKEPLRKFQAANTYLDDIEKKVENLVDEGYKYAADENQRKKFQELNERYQRKFKDVYQDPIRKTETLQNMMEEMKKYTPQKFKPLQEFQKEKAKETFANVALHAYNKYGDKAPVVSIENVFPGSFGFAEGKDMNQLIQKSREEFINRATKSPKEGGLGISKGKAKKKAEKLIGMTFDVGHLNLKKKYGYSDKDLQKEFAEMAKNNNLKHLHLTDNFGHHDSHLSPGMGNVPFKKYYEEMKKQGYNPDDIDQIVEAGGIVNQFGMMPHSYAVEAMGGSVYDNGQQPYWNQAVGFQQGYSSGYGEILPQGHYQQFGAGFAQLPAELGGSLGGGGGGDGSRMSGRPMQ